MTERVKRYVEIGAKFTFDFVLNHKAEYDALCAESKQIKLQMTVAELESLEKYVPKREFYMGVVPYIDKKKAEQKRIKPTFSVKSRPAGKSTAAQA